VDHDERVRLAGELAELLVERHGPAAIAAVGVHGSVARGDDTGESDLELAVVTAGPEVEVPDRSLRYRGTVVDLGAIAADAYLEGPPTSGRPGRWPPTSTSTTWPSTTRAGSSTS
jgi:hypothetical protein